MDENTEIADFYYPKNSITALTISLRIMKPIAYSIFIFIAVFIIVRHIYPMGFILYQGIVLGVFIAFGGLILFKHSIKDAILIFLLIYAFVFTVPTTVDRSYSVNMIMHMTNTPQGLTKSEVNRLYITYFVEQGGVNKRLEEQQISGIISENDDRYSLTKLGRVINRLFRFSRAIFVCEEQTN